MLHNYWWKYLSSTTGLSVDLEICQWLQMTCDVSNRDVEAHTNSWAGSEHIAIGTRGN